MCKTKRANVEYLLFTGENLFIFLNLCEECCERLLREKEAFENSILEKAKTTKFSHEIEVRGKVR